MATGPVVEMRGIAKAFAGVRALRDVDLHIHPSEVHALVGENGAGKSTLMRILSGAVPPDAGDILLRGAPLRLRRPSDALRNGIAMIHQELSLVPSTSVAENVLLGHEPRNRLGLLNLREMHRRAGELMAELDTRVDLSRAAESYSIATQQMIEVAKALSHQADVIVMDEPTSSLSEAEAERLFRIIERLKARGVGIVYITHKMEEIYRLADRITVLRDGELVGTAPAVELPQEQLIQWMVGRRIEQLFPKHQAALGEELLRVEELSLPADDGTGRLLVDGASVELRAGEIVGLAGLRGAGNSELLGALFGQFGARPTGRVTVAGQPVRITRPAQAIRHGLALLTNDRKVSGLVLSMSLLHNVTLADLRRVARGGVLWHEREARLAQPLADALAVRAASLDAEVSSLSGGNQQKVVLCKWLLTQPRVLLLDEPTRGIDVGAKAEVYALMNGLAAEGKGILLITSELPELLAMSDRLIVMHRGRITAHLSRAEATQESVMAAAMEV